MGPVLDQGKAGDTTLLLRRCVCGSLQARNDLHRHIFERVRACAAKELARFGSVSALVEADDVQQDVHSRLDRVLQSDPPTGSPGLWGLISVITPQVLIDLHRRASCRPMLFENQLRREKDQCSDGGKVLALDSGTVGDEPAKLAQWTEFHDEAMRLPEPQGSAFRLLWYGLLSRREVAEALNVTERTVYNYYRSALDHLRPYAPLPSD